MKFCRIICLVVGCLSLQSCIGQDKRITRDSSDLSIIFLKDSIISYSGQLTSKTMINKTDYDTSTINSIINERKKLFGKKLRLYLKLTDSISEIASLVNMIYFIEKRGINYSGWALDKTDIDFFKVKDFNWSKWEPPQPVAIQTPSSVITQSLSEDNAFLIIMKNDGTVWFNILSKNLSDTGIHRVLPPVTTNLKKAIADYEKSNADIIKRYLIKGDNDVSYKTFEQVIEALKQNNIFKYNLLTSQ